MNTNDEKNKLIDSSSNYSKEVLEKEKRRLRSKNKMIFLSFFISFMLIIFVVGGLIVALINTRNNPNNPNKPTTPIVEEEFLGNYVKKFKDYSEMQDFVNEINVNASRYSSNFIGGTTMIERSVDFAQDETLGEWGSATAPSITNDTSKGMGESEDYSTTNVQIGGVDEGDIVKNDGKYIYAINGNDVVIVDAFPAEVSSEVSRIKLNTKPSGIYINDDKLLIYGQSYSFHISEYRDIIPKNRFRNHSYVKIYNISDRSNPIETKSYDFEGNLSDSRMIGDYIYFVTSSSSYIYNKDYPVPILFEDGKLLSSDLKDANCNCPSVYYFDMNYYSYNFTTVSAININDLSKNIKSEIYMLDGYQNNLFVSLENLYITYNKRVSEEELTADIVMEIIKEKVFSQLTEKDKELIEKIENSDDDVLSSMEKYEKIIMIMMKYEDLFSGDESKVLEEEMKRRVKERYEDISKELEKTVIHKIGINNGNLKYKTSGEVTGVVLNQFSMDENNGYFRIATTKNRSWSSSFLDSDQRQSYSNIYVLDENMKVVGKVEGLAKGERIYSVRFMQNRAYLVTFKRVDPLFVIGLDDPTAPVVLGELKVPGYSSYLHPYDETTLIGLGKETDDNGRITGGIKLSLFDVSDVKNPKEIDKFVLGDRSSNSIAINEHKAFLFSKDKNLLAIPVTMREDIVKVQESAIFEEEMIIMPSVRKYFNGVAVFNINKKGFELKGKIDHSDDENKSWDRSGNVQRSLYIDNVLYTLSNKYLKANGLNDLNEIKSIELVDNHNYTPLLK